MSDYKPKTQLGRRLIAIRTRAISKGEIKEGDTRNCPKCGIRMEVKGNPCETENAGALWQCPECKNVELLWE